MSHTSFQISIESSYKINPLPKYHSNTFYYHSDIILVTTEVMVIMEDAYLYIEKVDQTFSIYITLHGL